LAPASIKLTKLDAKVAEVVTDHRYLPGHPGDVQGIRKRNTW